jgi:hypothetical protein
MVAIIQEGIMKPIREINGVAASLKPLCNISGVATAEPSCAPTSEPGFPLMSKPGKLLLFYSGPNNPARD